MYLGLSSDPNSPHYDYTNSIIGAANGLFSVGGVMGALILAWMADVYGRKKALLASSIVTILGGALSAGAAHVAMFIIGRWITGVGIGKC